MATVAIILLLIILIFIFVHILNRLNEQTKLSETLYDRLGDVTKEITSLKTMMIFKESEKKESPKPQPEKKEEFYWEKKPQPVEEVRPIPEPVKETIKEDKPTEIFIPSYTHFEKPPKKERDLEKFIGENLANKIGIAVLVLGIAFFVKYAIDRNWINEGNRVITGLVCGAILIGIAHRIRNSYRAFSSVLMGGGLAVFYFTVAFAFHEYQLIGQQTAFISMIGITAFAVGLSILYDRQELAILSIIGGFITPFLVSTGNDNYVALFAYLAILNSGMVVLSWFKRWPAINTICIFFTTIIYGGWMIEEVLFTSDNDFPFRNALFFATLFYVLFVIMNMVNTIRLKRKFKGFDFSMMLSTNFIYYAGGMIILSYWNDGAYQGLFTLLLGLVNLTLTTVFWKKPSADRNFVALLLGLALTFISLAGPVELDGNQLTLFWAAEMVLLFWVYQRMRVKQFKIASAVVTILMITSMMVMWAQDYFNGFEILPIMSNRSFLTTIVAGVAMLIYYALMRRQADTYYLDKLTNKAVRNFLLIGASSVFYLAGLLELYYQFDTRLKDYPVYSLYLQTYTFVSVIILGLIFRNAKHSATLRLILATASIVIYGMSLYINQALSISLINKPEGMHFIVHWISVAMLVYILYDAIRLFRANRIQWADFTNVYTWGISFVFITIFSVELYHVMYWLSYGHDAGWKWWENLYYKAGLTILWGFCSFAMMWLGMKHGFRSLRILSLTVFTVTLSKLFLFDIRNIPPGGKIAAFILLGILLLTVSFMYQRLKKIIIES